LVFIGVHRRTPQEGIEKHASAADQVCVLFVATFSATRDWGEECNFIAIGDTRVTLSNTLVDRGTYILAWRKLLSPSPTPGNKECPQAINIPHCGGQRHMLRTGAESLTQAGEIKHCNHE
jgi:hypothetical protein